MRRAILEFAACLALVAAPAGLQAAEIAVLRNGYEIRHEQRESLGATTRLYLNADRSGGFVDVSTEQIERYELDESVRESSATARTAAAAQPVSKPVDVQAAVAAASKTHAIDPDFIASVIRAESSFNPKAVSPKGAQGLMQLMPDTASKLGVKDSFDANANVNGGTKYLRELLLRYNEDMAKALAAYNAGPQRVDQYRGVPPYKETRAYVAKVIREFNQKKLAERAAVSKQKAAAKPGALVAGGAK